MSGSQERKVDHFAVLYYDKDRSQFIIVDTLNYNKDHIIENLNKNKKLLQDKGIYFNNIISVKNVYRNNNDCAIHSVINLEALSEIAKLASKEGININEEFLRDVLPFFYSRALVDRIRGYLENNKRMLDEKNYILNQKHEVFQNAIQQIKDTIEMEELNIDIKSIKGSLETLEQKTQNLKKEQRIKNENDFKLALEELSHLKKETSKYPLIKSQTKELEGSLETALKNPKPNATYINSILDNLGQLKKREQTLNINLEKTNNLKEAINNYSTIKMNIEDIRYYEEKLEENVCRLSALEKGKTNNRRSNIASASTVGNFLS